MIPLSNIKDRIETQLLVKHYFCPFLTNSTCKNKILVYTTKYNILKLALISHIGFGIDVTTKYLQKKHIIIQYL